MMWVISVKTRLYALYISHSEEPTASTTDYPLTSYGVDTIAVSTSPLRNPEYPPISEFGRLIK